jgi:hypothetical protein
MSPETAQALRQAKNLGQAPLQELKVWVGLAWELRVLVLVAVLWLLLVVLAVVLVRFELAAIRANHKRNRESLLRRQNFGSHLRKVLNWFRNKQ